MGKCNLVAGAFVGVVAVTAFAGQARAENWEADPVHSSVVFAVKHMDVALVYGRFNEISGTYTTGEENPSFNFTINAASVDTGNDQRDTHLKSPDFFDAETYPEISFTSTEVTADGEGYDAKGQLTLHGVTHDIEVRIDQTGVADTQRGRKSGLACTFTISRSDYGMNNMIGPVGDEVTLMIGIEGTSTGE